MLDSSFGFVVHKAIDVSTIRDNLPTKLGHAEIDLQMRVAKFLSHTLTEVVQFDLYFLQGKLRGLLFHKRFN